MSRFRYPIWTPNGFARETETRSGNTKAGTVSRSPLFHGICDWLLDRALREGELTDTVRDLGRKLVEGGLPIYRINVGGLLLHPVLGALDITWDSTNDTCRSQTVPRSAANSAEFQDAPFYNLIANNIPFERHRLDDPDVRRTTARPAGRSATRSAPALSDLP